MPNFGIYITEDLIKNGFTFQNLRSLQTLIGRKEMQKLRGAFVEHIKKNRYVFFQDTASGAKCTVAKFRLNVENGQHELSYWSDFSGIHSNTTEHQLLNNDITLENIKKSLQKFKAKWFDSKIAAKPLPASALEHSETMDLLYSGKYKVQQGMNKDGYYMTSVINKETKEPVQAFVKKVETSGCEESWEIFIKDSKGNYRGIGSREVCIDKSGNVYPCGMMSTQAGGDKYIGTGLRLHQITIERMLQSKGKTITIESLPSSFPFHYKCGFRVNPQKDELLSEEYCNEILNNYEAEFGISRELLEKALIKRKFGDIEGFGMYETHQELDKLVFLQNKGRYGLEPIPMELTSEALAAWIERIKAQPILEHIAQQ